MNEEHGENLPVSYDQAQIVENAVADLLLRGYFYHNGSLTDAQVAAIYQAWAAQCGKEQGNE